MNCRCCTLPVRYPPTSRHAAVYGEPTSGPAVRQNHDFLDCCAGHQVIPANRCRSTMPNLSPCWTDWPLANRDCQLTPTIAHLAPGRTQWVRPGTKPSGITLIWHLSHGRVKLVPRNRSRPPRTPEQTAQGPAGRSRPCAGAYAKHGPQGSVPHSRVSESPPGVLFGQPLGPAAIFSCFARHVRVETISTTAGSSARKRC